MLNFELFMINNAPDSVREFVLQNLFQRNKNHNNQNTAQGIDYKLEEYNKLFKQIEVSAAPTIEEWTKIASVAPQFKKILQQHSKDYSINYGLYTEPGVPDYDGRIELCLEYVRQSEGLKYEIAHDLKKCRKAE